MNEAYKEEQPYKCPDWMRTDDPASEIHPPRRYGTRTENEHIIAKIKLVSSQVDHTSRDCTMLYSPHWKNGYSTKKKWRTKRGFNLTTQHYGTKVTDKAAWKQLPVTVND